jgi:hypothetical protein
MQRQTAADCGKVISAGVIGAIATIACAAAAPLLPMIVGFFIEGASSSLGAARVALALAIASLTSWVLNLSPGSILFAWIVAATVSGVVGGFIGACLGSLGATLVLQRLFRSDRSQ